MRDEKSIVNMRSLVHVNVCACLCTALVKMLENIFKNNDNDGKASMNGFFGLKGNERGGLSVLCVNL
jgi:hypothetical protein